MPDRLAEIRARLDAATFQPDERGFGAVQMWSDGTITVYGPGNAEMIAHAPADIAWLLDELEKMKENLSVERDHSEFLANCLRNRNREIDKLREYAVHKHNNCWQTGKCVCGLSNL